MRFILKGHPFNITKNEVIDKLQNEKPETNSQNFLVLEDKLFPVKQVIVIITNLERSEFTTADAIRILLKLGFSLKKIDDSERVTYHFNYPKELLDDLKDEIFMVKNYISKKIFNLQDSHEYLKKINKLISDFMYEQSKVFNAAFDEKKKTKVKCIDINYNSADFALIKEATDVAKELTSKL